MQLYKKYTEMGDLEKINSFPGQRKLFTAINPFELLAQEIQELKEAVINMPANPVPEIIDRVELCKRLAITEQTAIRWGKRGKLPEIRIGNAVRYNWPTVVASLESCGR